MGCSSSKPATWGEDPQWGAEAESGVGGSVGTSTSYTVAPAASSAERGRSGGGALQPATPGAVGAASAAQGKGPSVAPGLIDKLRANFLVTATQGSVYDYYTLDKTLGTGGYAVVKLGMNKDTGREVAVKIMRLPLAGTASFGPAPGSGQATSRSGVSGAAESTELDVFKEIEILKTLDHPSVLKMHEYFIGGARDKVYIVMELMRGGELLDALLERGSYSEDDARVIFTQILAGVEYLHIKGITHRDLKLENLLLADKNDLRSVRISDFGLAKATFGSPDGENPFAMEVMCGTLAYVAPEVLARRPYGPAVDMWSCGVILFILLSGVVPFSDPDERRLMARIMAAKYSMAGPEWVSVSNDAKSLVQGLMCISPAARFTATQALQHPWLLLLHDATGAGQKPLRVASGRLAEYAARAKPPVRRFAPGDFLIRRGQRATAVYLIREGFVELLVDEPDASRPASDGGEAQEQQAEQRYTTLDRRGPGDFVGEQGVITDARGELMLSSSSRVARPSLAPMPGEGDSTASTERGPQMPPSGRPPRPPESGGIQRGEGEKRWSSPLSAHKFAKKWVGSRRTSSVRAVTDVIAVALRRADMEWVLTESPATAEEEDAASMRQELQHALRRSASKGRSTIGAGMDC